jgi:hypothetical protein
MRHKTGRKCRERVSALERQTRGAIWQDHLGAGCSAPRFAGDGESFRRAEM